MAMLIAWQAVNAKRHPNSRQFTKGFLITTPGITIRDRLRVLLPSDPENYYEHRNIVPSEFIKEVREARVVITNYHAFRLREETQSNPANRALRQGRGPRLDTLETEGKMMQRSDEPPHVSRTHHGVQRRGAPLLPGEARAPRHHNTGQGRKKSRLSEITRPPDSGSPAWNRGEKDRHPSGDRPLRDTLFPPGLRIPRRDLIPLDCV